MLCDINSGYGTLHCGYAGHCPGSATGNANPDCYWSSTELTGGSSVYRAMCLRGGGFVRPQCDVESRCTYTFAFTVRCVLDLGAKVVRNFVSSVASLLIAQTLQIKAINKTVRPQTPTLVMAPCSALKEQAAARALQTATATRTLYGRAQTETRVITVFFGWVMARLRLRVLVMIPAGVLIPTPLLCAVSWI